MDAIGLFLTALRYKRQLIAALEEIESRDAEQGRLRLSQRFFDEALLPALMPRLPKAVHEVSVLLGEQEFVVDLGMRILGKKARMRYVCSIETLEFLPGKHRVLLRYREDMLSGPALINTAVRMVVRRSWLQMLVKAPGLHMTKSMLSVDLEKIPGFLGWMEKSGLWGLVLNFGGMEAGNLLLLWERA
jgi:hypothetical protein